MVGYGVRIVVAAAALLLLAYLTMPILLGSTTPQVVIQPKAGTECIADPATMRREHPDMLRKVADDTVRGGVRGARASLKSCMACHASHESAAAAQTNSCVTCHTFTAVRMNCFECHATQPTPTPFHPIVKSGPEAIGAARLSMQLREQGPGPAVQAGGARLDADTLAKLGLTSRQ